MVPSLVWKRDRESRALLGGPLPRMFRRFLIKRRHRVSAMKTRTESSPVSARRLSPFRAPASDHNGSIATDRDRVSQRTDTAQHLLLPGGRSLGPCRPNVSVPWVRRLEPRASPTNRVRSGRGYRSTSQQERAALGASRGTGSQPFRECSSSPRPDRPCRLLRRTRGQSSASARAADTGGPRPSAGASPG